MYQTLEVLSSLFVLSKLRASILICLCALQDNLQNVAIEGVLPTIKSISSSAAGQLPINSVWKKLLHTLLTIKCFNNEFSNFLSQVWILLYLTVQTYHSKLHALKSLCVWSKVYINNFGEYNVSWGGYS